MAEESIRKEDILDFDGTIKGLQDLIAQIEKLRDVLGKDLKDTITALSTATKELNTATKQGQEGIKNNSIQADNLIAQSKEQKRLDNELAKAKAQLAGSYSNEAQEIAKLKSVTTAHNKEVRTQKDLADSAEGSVNSLKSRLKELTAEYNKLAPAAREKVAPAIKKITDELKKAEGAIGNNTRNVGNYTGTLLKLGKTLFAATGITAGFAGALKLGKEIIESTDALSDKFAATLNGWKEGFASMARAIANNDFKDFFKNIKEAVKEGQRYTETEDAIGDAARAMKIRIADNETIIINLRKEQNNSNKTETERIAIGKEIEKIIIQNSVDRVTVAKMVLENETHNAAKRAGFADEELEQGKKIVKAYLDREPVLMREIKIGEEYNELQKQLNNTVSITGTGTTAIINIDQKAQAEINAKIEALGSEAKAYGELAIGLANITDAQKDKITADYEAVESAKQSAINLRVSSKINAAEVKLAKEETDVIKKNKDTAEKYSKWMSDNVDFEVKKKKDAKEQEWKDGMDYAKLTFDQNQEAAKAEWDLIEERKKKREQDEKEKKELNQKIVVESFAIASNAISQLGDLYQTQKENELSAAGDNAVKRAEIEKKYAQKQQTLAIGQALVNGAMAITEIWRKWAANPVIAGIFIALSAASTIAQIAIIKAQKFAKGGSGILDGPSHQRGGVDVGIGEAEGGEHLSITSRRMTSKYGSKMLDAVSNSINQGKFFEVWANVNKEISSDPYTKKMYDLMLNTPTIYADTNGSTVKEYPDGRKYIIKRFYKN